MTVEHIRATWHTTDDPATVEVVFNHGDIRVIADKALAKGSTLDLIRENRVVSKTDLSDHAPNEPAFIARMVRSAVRHGDAREWTAGDGEVDR